MAMKHVGFTVAAAMYMAIISNQARKRNVIMYHPMAYAIATMYVLPRLAASAP